MKKYSAVVFLFAFIILNCGGGTQYRDATKDEGSREWGPVK